MLYYDNANYINLITDIMILYVTFLCSAYIFYKASNVNEKKSVLLFAVSGLFILPISEFLIPYSYELAKLYELFISVLIIIVVACKEFSLGSVVQAFISLGLAHGLKALSLFISGTIFWFIDYKMPIIIVYGSSLLCETILSFLFMKIPRFKKGGSSLEPVGKKLQYSRRNLINL